MLIYFLKLINMKGDEFSGYSFYNSKYFGFSKTEKELIEENVKRILLTRKGERVGEPEFGSNLKMFLFMPQIFVTDVLEEIKYSIEKFEPRVKVISCSLISAGQDEVVKIKLDLEIISESKNITIEVNV